VERRRSERLLSEPESSWEYFALLEEDLRHSPASESDASEPSFYIHPTITSGAFAAG